ncbi:MAG TPA: FG-GAP-like repeat-containing protein [Steroidobacteraceae bacterium]|nr:FG-GAP-like repeat-containing protein [Steroidobacteraceae bacterium]
MKLADLEPRGDPGLRAARLRRPRRLTWAAALIGVLAVVAPHAQSSVTAAPAGATAPSSPEAAARALQSGDATTAARLLEALTRQPGAPARLWRLLGSAYQQLHDNQRAISAYRQALALEADSPQALYGLGSAYAGAKNWAQAWYWLGRAQATHRFDMSQITEDPNLTPVNRDPRFVALLPRAADFEPPFVEPVRIIHEWRGEAANDQFGWIARNVGDVDGDGVSDVVISAPTHGAGGAHAGRIYVYSGRSGRRLWSADGAAGDELGTGLEAAGDTNQDGIPDVIASGPAGRGIARIFSGRDGRVLQEFHAESPDEMFGSHSAGAGDVDGDGCADVIVGSPGREGESKTAGHAYVYSGRTGARLRTLTGERPGDQFGSTVAGFSTGSQRYLIVGAPRAGPARHGRVYVYAGPAYALKFTIEADETGNALGLMFVSVPGDLDGDGVSDIYASDWSNAAHGLSSGRIYVHSGRTGARLLVLTGENAGDGFGTSASVSGDVDGDGRADLIIGAWQYGGAAVSGGRVYLYSGRDGRLLRRFTDRVPGDTLGFDAVGLGDIDGDGGADLLLSAAWSAVHGHHSGRVFVVSALPTTPVAH